MFYLRKNCLIPEWEGDKCLKMEIEGSGKVMAEKGNKKREESMRDVRTALEAGIEEVGGGGGKRVYYGILLPLYLLKKNLFSKYVSCFRGLFGGNSICFY